MTTLTFQNTTLSVISQNNQIWLSALEVGTALQYSHPIQNVTKLFERHSDEFSPCMTALIDMRTNGGIQKVRIFSLRGCHLIGMLSHTKVAKDFRKWVLDILDREVLQNPQPNLPLALPAPTVNREFKDVMMKILNYAMHYEQFQKSIVSSEKEKRQKQIEFLFSEIPDGDSYLFVFRQEISQDIQKASDLLFALNFS